MSMDPTAARRFVLELGVALHRFGTPVHRLESALGAVARHLSLPGQFFITPTQILAAFGAPESQQVSMVRVEPGEVDLEKLAALDRLADAVVADEMDIAQGVAQIQAIVAAPPRYGAALTVLAYGLMSASAAQFLRGGVTEIIVAGGIGVATGLLAIAFSRIVNGGRVFELIAAFGAAALAAGAASAGWKVAFHITTLAGLIALVPGLTLTVALNELATRHLVAGTARLTAAAIAFLQIAFGVALAEALVTRLAGPLPALAAPAQALPLWAEPAAVLVAIFAAMTLFRAHPRAALGICLAGFAAYYGARFGAWLLGPVLGASVGSFVVAAGSNIYARVTNRPALVPLVPGLLLLVPGSLGFQSLTSMVQREVVTGIDTAFTMILASVSLVAGMLIANFTVSPRRNL